jgi:transcriptional regulator with XRE-family HTH domain
MEPSLNLPTQQSFATVLRRRRHAVGISQEELAHRAGITMRYVSLLETGKRVPTIVVVFALATGLNCSASEFVEEIEKQNLLSNS